MRHTVLDIADSTACNCAYDRNELQAMFAMMTVARSVPKQVMSKNVVSKQNPQRAASPLMPHRPTECSARPVRGRRAPSAPAQQALFAVLDQMGARHRAARGINPFSGVMGDAD